MRIIPVDPYPIRPAFASFEAAIRHAKTYAPLARATAEEQQLLDALIIDGFWTDTDFVIRFSNGRFLHVWVAPAANSSAVDWRVLEAEPQLRAEAVGRVGSAADLIEFPKIGVNVMDRSAMLASRRGKPLRKLFINELGFYVYTPRQRILVFHCVRRRDTGENLLFVCEDD
jgi:hypothetical protein